MPFAPQIRKQILQALSEFIIPILQSQSIPQLLLGPPFGFPSDQQQVRRNVPLPDKQSHPLDVKVYWDEGQVVAHRMSQLAFSYHGVSEERVGVTEEMAARLQTEGQPVPPGVVALRLQAPVAFYVPLMQPHGGNCLGEEEFGPLRMLVAQFTHDELFIRHFDAQTGASHHININDPAFKPMERAYVELLESGRLSEAQRLLLEFMQRLRDYLTHHFVPISNSAWPSLDERYNLIGPQVSPRNAQLCRQAIDYIQFHLHTPLTLPVIARHCEVSPEHLCRIFRQSVGISLMNFVTCQRLRAAERILSEKDESIGDVARLVGFASSQSFANVFRRQKGMPPTEFKRRNINFVNNFVNEMSLKDIAEGNTMKDGTTDVGVEEELE